MVRAGAGIARRCKCLPKCVKRGGVIAVHAGTKDWAEEVCIACTHVSSALLLPSSFWHIHGMTLLLCVDELSVLDRYDACKAAVRVAKGRGWIASMGRVQHVPLIASHSPCWFADGARFALWVQRVFEWT